MTIRGSSPVGYRRAVPVFGMLEIVLGCDLIAGRSGLLGKFQVAGVLRHGALAAAPVSPTVHTTGTAMLWWFMAGRKPVPGS